MRVLYFAWLRERIGIGEEVIDPPAEVETVGALMSWLAARDETYAHAFANPKAVRAAIDQTLAKPSAPIANAKEIAFFPPMTGG